MDWGSRGNASGVNLPVLRGHNDALVLDLLRGAGLVGLPGLGRGDLARRTGLTPQAVSKITARLRAEGMVADAGREASTGGKPRTLLRLVPEARYAIGVHLDRDELTALRVDLAGRVVARRRGPLDFGAGPDAAVEELVRAVVGVWGADGGGCGRGGGGGGGHGDGGGFGGGLGGGGGRADVGARGEGGGYGYADGDGSGHGDGGEGGGYGHGEGGGYGGGHGDTCGGHGEGGGGGHGDGGGEGGGGGHGDGGGEGGGGGHGGGYGEGEGGGCGGGYGEGEGGGCGYGGGGGCVHGDGDGQDGGADGRLPVLGVGVAAPGPLDWRTGVLGRVTGHPEWEGFPLREVLEGRLGLPVLVDKDTNAGVAGAGASFGAAAAGEVGSAGAGSGGGSQGGGFGGGFGLAVAYVHVGTGLGAGLRLVGGGEVYRGRRSAAGEFGHQVLRLDGPPCRCGGRGCAEVLCLEAVADGRLEEAARIVGEATANLVALLDVDRVLLGGRVVAAAPGVFLDGVRAVVGARSLALPLSLAGSEGVRVDLAEVGVAEGAAELVLAPVFGRGVG
ncbi:hypothetical protein SAVIM338S_02796 [Streptomyces avidinii]